ncbi:MAG: hypothetical protein ACI4S4_01755 [Candidatus Ornithospirochaeta sp.]
MDHDIDPKILEIVRKRPISSNAKFNRFFGELTPEVRNVLETIIRHFIPGVRTIKSMSVQKYASRDKGKARIADAEIEMTDGEDIWVEMQNWNGKKEELKFCRWDDERHLQLKKAKGRKCCLLVLIDSKDSEGRNKIWNGFRDIESIRYSMKPDCHDASMDGEIFPEEANGAIMLLNMERLSKRSDTIGDIFHDLLVPGNVELKNKDMEKRRSEVFTEEEEMKMSYEEQELYEALIEPERIKSIKFMASHGISADEISKGIDVPLEKVKKILETK